MLIYHITEYTAWQQALVNGEYRAPSLATEGFIHASTLEQVVGTANLIFHGQDGLILLVIDSTRLKHELRFEESHGPGQKFPHIYGPLNLDAVQKVVEFPHGDEDAFTLPADL